MTSNIAKNFKQPQFLQLIVHGRPAPQGSKSFKGFSGNGRAILVESSKNVRPWRQDVVAAAIEAIGKTPNWVTIENPVHLTIEFYLPRPKSHPKTRRTVPKSTPDLSKLLRATEDALTTSGVWKDDALVIDAVVRKRYAVQESSLGLEFEMRSIGARITVTEFLADDTWSDRAYTGDECLPSFNTNERR